DAVPKTEAYSRYGNPSSYVVLGKRYQTLQTYQGYRERGIASWYGTKFHGHRTSSGEPYDMYAMSAAHKSLPLPTYARVTNLDNGKSVIVKINDRGPFHENRLIDLSYAAATRLEILAKGTGLVEVEAIDPRNFGQLAEKPPIAASQPKVTKAPSLYLQLGAFADRSNAERLQARLSSSLPEPLHISETVSNQQAVYRVRIGPLASIESADQLTKILAAEGIKSPRVVVD
ncbi:Septum-associated rare lipoprotein A, partial [hydrothermal vent metagenome]